MPIKIEISGVTRAQSEIRAMPAEVQRLAILRLSQVAYDSAQKGAGAHTKTGALFKSVYNRPILDGRQVGHDLTIAPYARWVLWGTKPHKIRAKNKKLLRWATNGRWFSKKEVNHPGYKGDQWMVRAADDAVRQFAAIIDKAFKDAA